MGSQRKAPSCKPHGGGRAELPTPLRPNIGTAYLRLQGGQDRIIYGSIGDAANRFGTSRSTIWRIAWTLRKQIDNEEWIDLSRQRKGQCGRKRKPSEEFFPLVAKIDALSIVCLFAECPDNAPNGAPTSPESIDRIADRSIGCSILDTLQPQNCRSNVESKWRWQLYSSATVQLPRRRLALRPHFWQGQQEAEKFRILGEGRVV